MSEILVLNGPNLNLLGTREPEIYGSDTLADIEAQVRQLVEGAGHNLDSLQSNAEHELIERLHAARGKAGFVIINPGAFTHTSVALHDAIAGATLPFIEVHISNIYQRESFRSKSITAPACQGVISGLGFFSYDCALDYLIQTIPSSTESENSEAPKD